MAHEVTGVIAGARGKGVTVTTIVVPDPGPGEALVRVCLDVAREAGCRLVRLSTQPVEEPEHPDDLRQLFEWIGWDRLLYSSDYPHWDFDDPNLAWRFQMTEVEKRNLLHDNALAVYSFK